MNTFNNLIHLAPRTVGTLLIAITLGSIGCHSHLFHNAASTAPSSHLPPLPSAFSQQLVTVTDAITETSVMYHIKQLAVTIGRRPAGSDNETQTAQYMAQQLQSWGYDIEFQPFTTMLRTGETVKSTNIIATRSGDDKWLVVGAHIDSVPDSVGAVDNASGVAALLETARTLSQIETSHTLVFIGFGAEEYGNPKGSDYYVQSLPHPREQIIAMLNIDAIGAGLYPYVHAGATIEGQTPRGKVLFDGGPIWVRELALNVANQLNYDMRTAPDKYWNGYTGAWSDHYAFVLVGVPVAYFEAWDWHGPASDPWWGQETPEGDISNTTADTLERIIPNQVERIAEVVAGTAIAIATGSPYP